MTEFGKLVRDRIPALIAAEGRRPVVERLSTSRRRPALLEKLAEECSEAAAASEHELPEELADVVEVVRALCEDLGISLAEVVALADEKRARRGGYDEGLFLVRAEEIEKA